MTTDPITDMLNRIRNAQAVGKETVSMPFSDIKCEIAIILEGKGFVKRVEKKGRKPKRALEITLKYQVEEGVRTPAIEGLKRISRPGQRIYIRARDIKPVRVSYGIAIISTSKGLMTESEARKQKLGGEILCEIW